MSRLYLHIGSHKTGTTSLQYALAHTLKTRSARHIPLRNRGSRLLTSHGNGRNFRARLHIRAAAQLFAEEKRRATRWRKAHTFVASDEALFWLTEPRQTKALADALFGLFDEVRIVCYLRRQTELAIAHRKQVVFGSPARRFYGGDLAPLPRFKPYLRSYFDYDRKLRDVWAPAFGKDNIIAVPFESDRLPGGDVIKDFSARTGIALSTRSNLRENASLAGNQTFLGLFLAQQGIDQATAANVVQMLPPEGKYLPSHDHAKAFQSHFDESNQRLSKDWTCDGRPCGFAPGFQRYPEQAQAGPWDFTPVRSQLATLLPAPAMAELGL